MYLESIELKRFNRFALDKYELFVYTPEQKLQLILGTNGSGKSSLMHELSPLPATSDCFDGGYKKTVWSHKNRRYVLKSSFENGNRHSFKLDDDEGEELNPSGTASVQRELVLQHFGITPSIHELMTGVSNFTSMAVNKRRELLTKMSGINFDYAMTLYDNAKAELRDTEAALKFQNSVLLKEITSLMNPDEISKLKDQIALYQEFIDLITQYKNSIYVDWSLTANTTLLERKLNDTIRELKKSLSAFSVIPYLNQEEDIHTGLVNSIARLAVVSENYDRLGKEIEDEQSLIESLKRLDLDSKANFKQEQQTIEQEITAYENSMKFFKSSDDADVLFDVIQTVQDVLYPVLTVMESNEDLHYSKQNAVRAQEHIAELKESMLKLKAEIDQYTKMVEQYDHLKEHGNTTCPKCNYQWIQGFDESKYQAAKTKIQAGVSALASLEEILQKEQTYLTKYTEYMEHYRAYMRTKTQFVKLDPVWDYVDQHKWLFKEPIQVLAALEQAKHDLPILIEIKARKTRLNELQKISEIQAKTQAMDIDKILKLHETNQLKFSQLQQEKLEANRKVSLYSSLKEAQSLIGKQHETLQTLDRDIEKQYNNELALAKHAALQQLLRKLQFELGELQQQLVKSQTQVSVVAQIQQQIDLLQTKKETFTAIVAELSPKDGLIAKAMSGFLNHFLGKINQIMSKIWAYPLELSMIPLEEGVNLDYRFEVRVKDNKPIKDVSECSKGMREMIDLIFRIVGMNYLGLTDIPVYLDEFGSSMDHTHRARAFEIITQYLAYSHYTQIFVISHHEQLYGSLRNADIVVLNPDNIVLHPDSKFNAVVQLVRS